MCLGGDWKKEVMEKDKTGFTWATSWIYHALNADIEECFKEIPPRGALKLKLFQWLENTRITDWASWLFKWYNQHL